MSEADDDVRQHGTIERLRYMESSKFWRLRNAFFAARRTFIPGAPRPTPRFVDPAGRTGDGTGETDYDRWIARNEPSAATLATLRAALLRVPDLPLVSIIMPVHDPAREHLVRALASVHRQVYPNWQLCVADDGSTLPDVRTLLAELPSTVRTTRHEEARGIGAATQSALALASGEWVAFLDHDDELSPDALAVMMIAVLDDPEADFLYSDEDKLDEDGRRYDPYFKPDWSPHTLLSRNYVAHLAAYRRSLLDAVGGIREGFDGSQDHDLALRAAERARRIVHIPQVLYHWRSHRGSTAGDADQKLWAYEAGARAVRSALARRGVTATVTPGPPPRGTYVVRVQPPTRPQIAVIVPTRDNGEDVERCADALISASEGADHRLYIVDNGTKDPRSLAILARLVRERRNVTVIERDEPFNYSRLNNAGVRESHEQYVLLLNDDVVLKGADSLVRLAGFVSLPDVGAVGAKLLFPDGAIQHAGVATGVGSGPHGPGVAGHPHKYESGNAHGYFRRADAQTNVSAVTAACLMTTRAIYDEVGGFDEAIAVAFNDVDFCLRIRATGRWIVYVPDVQATHHESRTRGSDDTAQTRPRFQAEVAFMRQRWGRTLDADPFWSPHLSLLTESPRVRLSEPVWPT